MTASDAIFFWSLSSNADLETIYRRANTAVRLSEEEKVSLETLVPDLLTRTRLIEDSKSFSRTYGKYK